MPNQNRPRRSQKTVKPRLHGHSHKDADRILQQHGPDPATLALRKETLVKLRQLVQAHAGPHFDVCDTSFYTYALDLESAPMEFTIIDRQHPHGLKRGDPVPAIYDSSCLARILTEAGFNSELLSSPSFPSNKATGRKSTKNPVLAEHPLTTPWSEYDIPPRTELVYPATVQSMSSTKFFVTLPGPTVPLLSQFIRSSISDGRQLSSLFSFVWMWLQSHGMKEIMPTTLALMVIQFMRAGRNARNLIIEGPTRLLTGDHRVTASVTVPHQYREPAFLDNKTRPDPFQYVRTPHELRVDFIARRPPPDVGKEGRIASLFVDFLSFWDSAFTDARNSIFPVRAGASIPRREDMLEDSQDGHASSDEKHPSQATVYGHQPSVWRAQRLVMPDPFVQTYNHAAQVSASTTSYFAYHAALVAKNLKATHPLTSIFGKQPLGVRPFHATARAPNVQNLDVDVPPAVAQARSRTIQKVQNVISEYYGKEYRVEAFGSTRYGVSQVNSDLDLVVLDPARMHGHSPNSNPLLPPIYDVKALSKVLQRAGFTRVLAIPGAVVPIVKLYDPVTRLDCDININEQLGLLNTGLVKRYCDLSPLMRPMIVYLKRWAKSHNLNSPSSRWGEPVSFSSYALVLMTIGYLQTRQLLPNLQGGLGPLSDDDAGSHWVKAPHGKAALIQCDVRFKQAEDWVAPPADVDEALRGWLAFWGSGFDYKTQMMSIRHGGLLARPPLKSKAAEADAAKTANDVVEPATTSPIEETSDAEEALEAARDAMPATSTSKEDKPFNNTDDLSQHETRAVSEEMPAAWAQHAICVIDPFIRARNVGQNIVAPTINRFVLECQRSEVLLGWGAGLDDLVVSVQDLRDVNPQELAARPQQQGQRAPQRDNHDRPRRNEGQRREPPASQGDRWAQLQPRDPRPSPDRQGNAPR